MLQLAQISRDLVYLEETMVVNYSILVVQQRKEGVLCMQQHLPLPFFLSLSSTVHAFFQRQDLTRQCSQARGDIKLHASVHLFEFTDVHLLG